MWSTCILYTSNKETVSQGDAQVREVYVHAGAQAYEHVCDYSGLWEVPAS